MERQLIYEGVVYISWRELKEGAKLITCKVKAMIKNGKIIRIIKELNN